MKAHRDPQHGDCVAHHENPEVDRVLSENPRYATVEKFLGAGARIARDRNPRR